jgi:hypothetical protein
MSTSTYVNKNAFYFSGASEVVLVQLDSSNDLIRIQGLDETTLSTENRALVIDHSYSSSAVDFSINGYSDDDSSSLFLCSH